MIQKETLQKLGLTESESKVYLSLIKIGEFTSKGAIIKEAKIASSKVYIILDKLIDKGLVSTITKNNIKRFAAAPPERIKDYVETKKQEIAEEEDKVEQIIPELNALYKSFRESTRAEIFMGWQGMETAYSSILSSLKKGEILHVLGASAGTNPEKTKRFYYKYGLKANQKAIEVRIIFNENARSYVKQLEKEAEIVFDKRFLFKTTPIEIAIAKDSIAIVMLKEEPLVILVHDKETAESFVVYFKELWKTAKR